MRHGISNIVQVSLAYYLLYPEMYFNWLCNKNKTYHIMQIIPKLNQIKSV